MLFAALPDRLHGEVLSPLGAPQLILDGGDGVLAATLVERGQAFVGPADPAVLGRLLGARVELRQLVHGLVLGEWDVPGYRFERSGATPGLPASLAIDDGTTRLSLKLRRLRPLEVDAQNLGSGRPPAGVEVRPLAELEAEDFWGGAPPAGSVEGS